MGFKLGYSTYALKMLDPFEALHLIKNTGYDAFEVCMREGWPTSPRLFSSGQQVELAKFAQDLGFSSPIFFGSIDVCASGPDRITMMDLTKQKFDMAHRLNFGEHQINITTTPGPSQPSWDSGKAQIVDAFLCLADLAAGYDAVVAIEPHAGTDFETPEKAVWLMEQTVHPNLKLDLDISHFVVEGSQVTHSVNLCAPFTSMVHIKDGKKQGDVVQFCLVGDGDINIPEFLTALRSNELENLPVFAEVSGQQSTSSDYDPKRAAELSFASLDKAMQQL